MALLAKQIWRIVTNPNLLVSKVLKAKYMKEDAWLGQQPPNNASWCWKSMHKGGELLQQRLWKRVGDGRSVKIWHDRWIPGLVDGRVTTVKPIGCQLQFVHELIEGEKWKNDLLKHWFNVVDVDHITNFPLSLYDRKDRLFWNYSKSGIYTVKTGYVVAKEQSEMMNRKLASDLETSWEIRKHTVWKRLWSLNVKMKQKHFLWRCLQNGMATNEVLYKRFGISNMICHCCEEETETIEHIFFFCPKAKVIWKLAPVRWEGLVTLQGNLWR